MGKLLWCLIIVGILVSLQCFNLVSLAMWPFGKEIVYGDGMFPLLVNVIWIVFFGLEIAVSNLIIGHLWCITIIGIPFGKQFFKLAQLSLLPFGAQIATC